MQLIIFITINYSEKIQATIFLPKPKSGYFHFPQLDISSTQIRRLMVAAHVSIVYKRI
jgi:hypothetical protein